MKGLNKVVMIGTLVYDPKSKTTRSGKDYVYFRMAFGEGKYRGFATVFLFGKSAAAFAAAAKKNSTVLVEGQLQSEEVEVGGKKKDAFTISSFEAQVLNEAAPQRAEEPEDDSDEEIPF